MLPAGLALPPIVWSPLTYLVLPPSGNEADSQASSCTSSRSDSGDTDDGASDGSGSKSSPSSSSQSTKPKNSEEVWQHAMDNKKTRAIQKDIEKVAAPDASQDTNKDLPNKDLLMSGFKGHVVEASQHLQANYALTLWIQKLPEDSGFIIRELLGSRDAALAIMDHKQGCRSFNSLIKVMKQLPHDEKTLLQRFLEEITQEGMLVAELLSKPVEESYARYPLSLLLQQPKAEEEDDRAFRNRCRHNVAVQLVAVPDGQGLLGKSQSYLVEELLWHSQPETFEVLCQAMLKDTAVVKQILKSEGGYYAFQTLKQVAAQNACKPLYKDAGQRAAKLEAEAEAEMEAEEEARPHEPEGERQKKKARRSGQGRP